MNKKWILTILCAFVLVLLAGCASNAATLPSPSPAATTMMPSPSMMPSVMPVGSPSPGVGTPETTAPGTTGAGVMTMDEAKKTSKDIMDELNKLSEVSQSSVVTAGDTAVIGIMFDSQYQGGLTKRITDMINNRVGTVNTGIKNIAVTAQAAQVKSIQDLYATMENAGTSMSMLQSQVDALYKSITANGSGATTSP